MKLESDYDFLQRILAASPRRIVPLDETGPTLDEIGLWVGLVRRGTASERQTSFPYMWLARDFRLPYALILHLSAAIESKTALLPNNIGTAVLYREVSRVTFRERDRRQIAA